jgi:ribosomal protein RSM22 (predicted rRNA methylase)
MAEEVELTSEARITKARELFTKATNYEIDRRTRGEAWGELWMNMKTWKRNWAALGFSKNEIERIKLNKPDWI